MSTLSLFSPTKTCTLCGETKPLDEYYRRRGGRASRCRTCLAKADADRRDPDGTKRAARAAYAALIAQGLRRCAHCGEVKALHEDFPRANTKTGRHSFCKPCNNQRRAEYLANGGRDIEVAKRYKITVAEAKRLRLGPCQACGNPPPSVVDHDHATGRVRGALCIQCNAALGQLRDSPDVITGLLAYLLQHHDG